MKFLIFISSLVFLLSYSSYGMVVGPVKVEGTVVKYDKEKVILDQNGQKITVPRSAIPKEFKLRTGEKVYALLDEESSSVSKKQTRKKPVKPATRKK